MQHRLRQKFNIFLLQIETRAKSRSFSHSEAAHSKNPCGAVNYSQKDGKNKEELFVNISWQPKRIQTSGKNINCLFSGFVK